MSKNSREVPFTEAVERILELARERADSEKKVRGVLNDVYVFDLPVREDWSFLMNTTSLTFTQEYATGNATINTGGSTVTFSSDVTIDSSMVGRKIKFTDNDYVYDIVSMSGNTGAVIGPTLSGTVNISAGAYSIFRQVYPLASDFDRFPKNGGFHLFQGGKKRVVPEKDYQAATNEYSPDVSTTLDYCYLAGVDTAGNRLVVFVPPIKDTISGEYDYVKKLRPLRETTDGTVSVSASDTTVFGTSTNFANANTGDYFRIDAFGTGNDSEWYRIVAINGTALTLQTAFGNSGATGARYTVSSVPETPAMFHLGIMHGGLARILGDQNDPMAASYAQQYANVMSDGKRIYKTRVYPSQVNLIAEDWQYRR